MFSTQNSRFIGTLGDSEYLDCPEGLAIDSERSVIYIANYNSNNVVKYDLLTKKYIGVFASASTTLGHLKGPESVIYDPLNNVIGITCYANNSVLFLAHDGTLVRVIGGFVGTASPSATAASAFGPEGDSSSRVLQLRQPFELPGPVGLARTPQGTFAVTLYKVITDCIHLHRLLNLLI
jgi:DNA-binding beta-propeller fold protein YncE